MLDTFSGVDKMTKRISRPIHFKLQMRLILILIILFVSFSTGSTEQETVAKTMPMRVLFVGNSLTYWGNLPQIVSLMAKKNGIQLITEQITAPGATLEDHWTSKLKTDVSENLEFLNGKYIEDHYLNMLKTSTVKKIESGNYNAVILQEQTELPFDDPEKTIKYIGLFCDTVKKSGATPYIFLTWVAKQTPQKQEKVTKTYLKAASANNARIVPVGISWELANKLRPEISLYWDDFHPTAIGEYLCACVFFKALTGESPKGQITDITTIDEFGEFLHLLAIETQDAEFCQRVAEEAFISLSNMPLQ
jgi:hypothetical protein